VIFFGSTFNITSLITLPKDMSKVILNLVKKTQWSKSLCSMRSGCEIISRRKFLTSACKVITFHIHQLNTSLPKCTGHCKLKKYIEYLCLGKLKVGKLEKKKSVSIRDI
jgi:hypothetical protein